MTTNDGATNRLEQLRRMTKVVADSGNIDAIREHKPVDATTNPSLLLQAASLPAYKSLLKDARHWSLKSGGNASTQLDRCVEKFSVNVGCEILQSIPGRISTEVSARYSYDKSAILASARRIIGLYNDAGIGNERVLIKTASTWEGIEAARVLEAENIQCNLTLLFGFGQAVACAEAGVFLISPFVGRILDWHKARSGRDYYPPDADPGVQSVTRIFNFYKQHGYTTIVMGASFRNSEQIAALAGCDQLTISPQLLAELAADTTPMKQALHADAPGDAPAKRQMSASDFHWELNEDEMASDKLAEGIRNFYAHEVQMREFLTNLT